MSNAHKFKYPIFISIVLASGFLMMTAITIGMTASTINEGKFTMGRHWTDIIFNVSVNILMPAFLMSLGLIGLKRLRFSFTTVVFDSENKKIAIERFNSYEEINFSEVVAIKDFPNKSILLIESQFRSMIVPKEVNGYFFLYALLKENELLKENFDFRKLKTTPGLFTYVIGFGMLTLTLMLLPAFPSLIENYNGSLNSIMSLTIMTTLAIGMFMMVLLLANRYEFTDEALLKINPLHKKVIKYSNIESIDYDDMQRTITINLIVDNIKWLRKLNGQPGIIIREPGNVSIEEIYAELEKRNSKQPEV